MKVLGCMLARRIIATADVPTFGAAPQVQPPSTARQALDAAISARFYSWIDSPNALVLVPHCASPKRVPVFAGQSHPQIYLIAAHSAARVVGPLGARPGHELRTPKLGGDQGPMSLHPLDGFTHEAGCVTRPDTVRGDLTA
jgi:hypothetical protein